MVCGQLVSSRQEINETNSIECTKEETNEGIILRYDLPGFEEKEVSLELSGEILKLGLILKDETDTYSVFKNKVKNGIIPNDFIIKLPNGIDKDKIDARVENGVLLIFFDWVDKKTTIIL